jgi:glucoamylase
MLPRWTSSAKEGVGTALTQASRVWFTISHGILNEVYYPRIDQACTRDFGLIVTGPDMFFSEEKRHATHDVEALASGVPGFELTNRCVSGRYRIVKRVIADPARDVVLQHVRFEALIGAAADYRVFALLAPHLVNAGASNTAWIGEHKGDRMLFAEGRGTALAVACSAPWRAASAGFVGESDGWQELGRHGALESCWDIAADGNVALTGEIDLAAGGEFVLALGFGRRTEEAAHRARSSLEEGFTAACRGYVAGWRAALDAALPLTRSPGREPKDFFRISVGVMLAHEPISFAGAIIASLSIPWGFAKGDDDIGGYHLVWPRDLVQTAGGLLAAGLPATARSVLCYLQAVQEKDGRWPQNMWLDGTAFWGGVQLDECAFPILLYDLLHRERALEDGDPARFLGMIERAASFIVANGPMTGQDRWEEDSGFSVFTLAVTVAGLAAAAAAIARVRGDDDPKARYLLETADSWNDDIERWTYAADTDLARRVGVGGYYVRIAPPAEAGRAPLDGTLFIKNRPAESARKPAVDIVSPDALALVRYGLRAADDPRILNTIRVIDDLLRADLPQGPVWRRYNEDGYGEHADGGPFDGSGIGRPWPLLTGERAHYELAAGDRDAVELLVATIEGCANAGGLLPEQVWDAADLPEHELFRGCATGSAMPLVWAHAEYVKLLRSMRDGRVFDMPVDAAMRYAGAGARGTFAVWRQDAARATIAQGKMLRVEVKEPALVHWSFDAWATRNDTPARDSGTGVYVADIPTEGLSPGAAIVFTLFWRNSQTWSEVDVSIAVRAVTDG